MERGTPPMYLDAILVFLALLIGLAAASLTDKGPVDKPQRITTDDMRWELRGNVWNRVK
jgi:hypothetical protein